MAEREQITVGPFTWIRDTRSDEECWDLQDSVDLIGYAFWCTNYGPSRYPGSSFSGWRCGSGGPFTKEYASRDDAMRGVISFLIERMCERRAEAVAKLRRLDKLFNEIANRDQASGLRERMENGGAS